MWCGISSKGLIGPLFFESTASHYHQYIDPKGNNFEQFEQVIHLCRFFCYLNIIYMLIKTEVIIIHSVYTFWGGGTLYFLISAHFKNYSFILYPCF